MRYHKLGRSDLEVSVVSLGTWAMGGEFFGRSNDREAIKAIEAAIDKGMNFIDTAPAYGTFHSETLVGQAIANKKDKCIIATKVGVYKQGNKFVRDLKPETLEEQIDGSLTRLGLETIPLCQIHWPDEEVLLEDTLEELKKIQNKGKFKYLGVCNFPIPLIEQTRKVFDVVSVQPRYSLLDREMENDLIPYCIAGNIGIITYGTLGGGVLSSKYLKRRLAKDDKRASFYPYFKEPLFSKAMEFVRYLDEVAIEYEKSVAQIAINWVTMKIGVTSAIVGARKVKDVIANVEAGEEILSREEFLDIDEKYEEIFKNSK